LMRETKGRYRNWWWY